MCVCVYGGRGVTVQMSQPYDKCLFSNDHCDLEKEKREKKQ